LTRAIPVSAQLPHSRVPTARRDLVAGVTVAALALPAAMAYAEVAGLSPVSGLYALLLPTVAYVLFGSSRQLIIGPEGSISTLVAAAILPLTAAASPDSAELAAMLRCWSQSASRSLGCCAWAGSPTTSPARCWSATSMASPSF
jgi:MFS superfamily sulfate permease-like transporter